jgi:hypothetical protein
MWLTSGRHKQRLTEFKIVELTQIDYPRALILILYDADRHGHGKFIYSHELCLDQVLSGSPYSLSL